jgi:hypothetical protein
MSIELTGTLAGNTGRAGAEDSTPVVVRDPQWIEAALTVIATAVVIIMVSVLAVAMNLT